MINFDLNLIVLILNIVHINIINGHRHIVFALLDDIGYSDISSTGGQFPTPFIDELRDESIILNRHYIHHKCSPSRTHFLTGRRCMNLGFGQLLTWPYTSIGGIPIGQPTIANWLRDFTSSDSSDMVPKYATYGIGKWHIGYSTTLQTPHYKGFDHYFGFYQGGIDYVTKEHPKSHFNFHSDLDDQYQNELNYDLWEDEEPSYSTMASDRNVMYFYQDKISDYLNDFSQKQEKEGNDELNLYLYLGVQTLHGPFEPVTSKTEQCLNILGTEIENEDRLRLCEYTLLTDDYFKYLVSELKSHNLWDDTLLVFTGDNGGNLDSTNCNFPLRGTKSTYFDGNIRQITFITGGKNVIPTNQYGTIRESLISNLDWTPTLLSYANILPYINKNDYQWDGVDVWDIIINGDNKEKERQNLMLNVRAKHLVHPNDLKQFKSTSILFKYGDDDHLYKYILADADTETESGDDYQWIYRKTDGWCLINDDGSVYIEKIAHSDYRHSGKVKDNQFLFDLTDDEGERYNLIRNQRINGDTLNDDDLNMMLDHIQSLLIDEMNLKNNKDFYHYPLKCLRDYDAMGDPNLFFQETPVRGCIVKPFLNRNQYLDKIVNCFIDEEEKNRPIPDKLKDLYLNDWIPPKPINNNYYVYNDKSQILIKNNHSYIIELIIGVVIFIIIGIFYLYKSRNKEYLPL